MSAVKNFTFFSLHVFPFICKIFLLFVSFVSIISYLLYTQISVVIQRFTTSEDVCWNIRNEHTNIRKCLSPRFAFCFLIRDLVYLFIHLFICQKKIEFRLFRLFWIPNSEFCHSCFSSLRLLVQYCRIQLPGARSQGAAQIVIERN